MTQLRSIHFIVRQFISLASFIFLLLLQGCSGSGSGSATDALKEHRVGEASGIGSIVSGSTLWLRFSEDISTTPRQRIASHISSALEQAGGNVQVLPVSADIQAIPNGDVAIVIGQVSDWQQFYPLSELPEADEAFVIKTAKNQQGATIYFAMGNPGGEYRLFQSNRNIGNLYAAYALLEKLGMAFLHPLQPTVPNSLSFPAQLSVSDQPYWPIRGWHLHTQHPLELTHVLNGWGAEGVDDKEGWLALLPEWESFLEWAIANRQNRVQWFLLRAESWGEFADSAERQKRLKVMVDMAHEWGIDVGVDAPIAFKQQHAWTMLRELKNETVQIQWAVDWLSAAGFDFINIEMGFSEFTHPSADDMLSWMDEVTRYGADTYGIPTYVKVHCTQNQVAKGYVDPETGEPLNFNFLGYYADSRLGVMPHTVQYYDLEGPAPTYDNENFDFIRRYMQLEAGRREVLWYPETAYWVSYDVDVPLFLPIYADRRLFDLRLIAQDELEGRMGRGDLAGSRIQGQMNFSSGWEWSYWLNDVVTARSVWNPRMDISDHKRALAEIMQITVKPFGEASEQVKKVLLTWMEKQNDLFIHGEVNGERPETPAYRNAQAYLQGWETWDDVNLRLGMLETQPRKMGLIDMDNPLIPKSQKVSFKKVLRPLFIETVTTLRGLYNELAALEDGIPPHGQLLYQEIKDSMEITVLRAEQVYNLYETSSRTKFCMPFGDMAMASMHLTNARSALDRAQQIVDNREQYYRADPERIAGWNYNPTAYHFGYLWTVRSLHYWWRDEAKAVDCPASPSYLNIMDPVDVANGEGYWKEFGIPLTPIVDWVRAMAPEGSWIHEFIQEPAKERTYPQDGLRDRPFWLIEQETAGTQQ